MRANNNSVDLTNMVKSDRFIIFYFTREISCILKVISVCNMDQLY